MNPNSAPPAGSNPPAAAGPGLRLVVKGLGNVPAMKNSKRLFFTNKKRRQFMDLCIGSFTLQLISPIATASGGTLTADSLRSLIALLPPDDSWKFIPSIQVSGRLVPKGEEGACIHIQLLP